MDDFTIYNYELANYFCSTREKHQNEVWWLEICRIVRCQPPAKWLQLREGSLTDCIYEVKLNKMIFIPILLSPNAILRIDSLVRTNCGEACKQLDCFWRLNLSSSAIAVDHRVWHISTLHLISRHKARRVVIRQNLSRKYTSWNLR